ncbi:MAG TPA: Xaa-Pro peptidase family protein [Aggregatilineales bacterium]|nr:Xaa-Pro peptidase family protein [Aggregatilineales bacterium]
MDYPGRVHQLRQNMQQASIDLVFVPISADLQYLAGIPRTMPNFGLTIHNGRWLEGAFIGQSVGPVLVLPRMTAEFDLQGMVGGELRVITDQEDTTAAARELLGRFKLGKQPHIALGVTTQAETAVALQQLVPDVLFSNASELIRPLRQIKSGDDLDVMRRAGAVTEAAFGEVLKHLKHGMTENEINAEVDLQLRRHGALGPSFVTTMYNSGPKHHLNLGLANTARNESLLPPVSLLFDFGAAFEGYCYDYGRTVFFGEPDAEMMKVYNTIMASQAAGIKALKASAATCQEVDRAARAVVVDAGYGPNFRHRLGHGIGLDVHEPPFLIEGDTTTLQAGMTFTIEPSIIVPDGFSARVEDIILATPKGGEPLTSGFQVLQVIE